MVVGNKLRVMVMNGRGLQCKDAKKQVTPYCLLQLGKTSHETRYIGSDSNPEWNEEFVFDVSPGCEVLSFSIWHKNTLKNDVVIGYAFVDFGSCKRDEKTSVNIQLMGIYSGEINLVIHPMYETTASKVERLEHKIMLLTYEMSRCTGKMDQLNKRTTELTLENRKLNKTNKLLEKEKKLLLEYEILSMSGTPSPRRAFSNVFVYDIEAKTNGTQQLDTKSTRCSEDEFDIISERDIVLSNKDNIDKHNGSHAMNGNTMVDIDRNKFTLNDWERHLSESIELFEDELERLNNNEKDDGERLNANTTQIRNENNELITKVTDLESENNELKLLIQQMKVKNDEELNLLIEHINPTEGQQHSTEGQQHSTEGQQQQKQDKTIRNQITQISNEKIENEAKIEMLKEVISELDVGINQLTSESNELSDTNIYTDVDDNCHTDTHDPDTIDDYEEITNDETVSEKEDEPDVIREYYWDEYLPISTKHSNDGFDDGSNETTFDDMVDGITQDIDDFIKSNYIFHHENTLILRSDPELYTKSDIEEENEHFKDINIRLIKENEELDGCLQLLQVQVKNLKKIQSILFDQLIKRVPSYMTQMLEKITDASQVLNEDQVTLYTTHFGAVLDEMINLTDGQLYTDSTDREDYNFAISLLYHQLST